MKSYPLILRELVILIGISAILGLLAQLVLPNGISPWTEITVIETESKSVAVPAVVLDPNGDMEASIIHLEEAFNVHERGQALFLDAREPDVFDQGHIAGAINLTPTAFMDSLMFLESLDLDRMVITYCDGTDCNASIDLAANLELMGFTQVRYFFGGWQEWETAGYPVDGGRE